VTAYRRDELALTLFEESGDALFLFDPATEQLVDTNPMAERLSGFSHAELLQMKATYLFRSEVQGGLVRLRHAFLKTGLFHSQEGFLLRHRDEGVWVPVNLTVTRLHARPQPLGLITARDITERREVAARVERAEAELRRVLASVTDCLWSAELDAKGDWAHCYYSPVVEAILGRPPEAFPCGPESWAAAVHPEERPRWEHMLLCLRTGRSLQEELVYQVIRPDGSVRWVRESVTASQGPDGRPSRLQGVVTDVTEHHQAEEILRQQAQIIDQIHDAVVATDMNGYVASWNKGAEKLYGYRAEEMIGKHVAVLYREEDRDTLPRQVFGRLQALGSDEVETPARKKSGETFYIHLSLSLLRGPDGTPRGMIGYSMDVTERKRAEASLRDSEALYHSLVESLPQNVFRKDRAGRFTFANQRFAALLGRSVEEILGKTDFDFYPRELAEKYRQDDQRVLDTGATFETVEEHDPPGGPKLYVEVVKTPVHDARGEIIGTQAIFWDITTRKRAEEALHRSEERYRRFFEEDLSGAFIATPAGKLLACNPAFTRIFNFPSIAEAMSHNLASLYAAAHDYEAFVELLRREKRLELHEIELRRRDGKAVHAIANVVGLFDERGPLSALPPGERRTAEGSRLVEIKGYVFDNTERKRLEEQFRQAQKMEAVGRLAGGVAHDFNNLLTVITGYSEILLGRIPAEDLLRPMVVEVQKAAERAAGLTRQLLAFSRKQILAPVEIDLNAVVADMEAMIRRLIGEDIVLVAVREPLLGRVTADRGQIEQVLMNLVVNARDAMPHGGELAIETHNVLLDGARRPGDSEFRPGPYVLLAVRDSGCGMDATTKARLFEPFFTTKEVGKGTGLGLATAYGIIKQSKGHIEVESEPGRGTTFTIYLPRTTAAVREAPADVPANGIPGGNETVLLVEDEDAVRQLSRQVLEMIGYRVLEARNGPEALAVCEQNKGAIHLMVTDVVMPQMSGCQLADRLAPLYPDMRVLYLSGYTDEAIGHHGVRDRAVHFLSKPFTLDSLARKVREALDKKPVA
jgi:PAS domain S-box-containing protein